ncbi:thiolase family protein [Chloroflexota bacterium]
MTDVYIIGVGMTRFAKFPDETVRTLAHQAMDLALKDAGIESGALQAGFFSNTLWGYFTDQHSIRGQVVFRSMGIDSIPVANVENACAGGSTALHLACMAIEAGKYDVVIAVGSEKISHPDKAKMFRAFDFGLDVENFDEEVDMLLQRGRSFNVTLPAGETAPGTGRSVFMDVYATMVRWHMDRFGTTQEQLAMISSKNHFHGSLNPLSQYQKPMTTKEVMADVPITYPLTRSMCAPIGDGAAAAVVCSEQYLKKLKDSRPVKILASILGQGRNRGIDEEDIGFRLSKQAYDIAGVGPDDIDVAEVHDATSYGELHQVEAMGFCPLGDGGVFAASGATVLGGRIPVNPSGGLECRGHPIGASGLGQIYELVQHLRGDAGQRQVEDARLALAENGGGFLGIEEAAMGLHILEQA